MTFGLILFIIFLSALLIAGVVVVVKYRQRLGVFIEEVKFEMSKVAFPSREEVINSTVLVFVTTIALTLMIWLVDLVFGQAVKLLFR